MEFGERLTQMRETQQMSQETLAKRSGIEPSVISHFESGRRNPSLRNFCRLVTGLVCSADALLGLPTTSLDRWKALFTDEEWGLLRDFVSMLLQRRVTVKRQTKDGECD